METYEEMLTRHQREVSELSSLPDLTEERRAYRKAMLMSDHQAELDAYPNHPMFDAPVETSEEEEQRINAMLSDDAYERHLREEKEKHEQAIYQLGTNLSSIMKELQELADGIKPKGPEL
ncbi:hypothetical protein LXM25_05875 [Dyadobacter sp. LJ53]|uniref:hypothetical protein n=1 Tax=Dyadobacter chenwenxiniae TaxID=2906456 RepID=UPI001F15A71D|nr:hypothetical protein [Dyadobacter chenwenxiniae]MCF0049572.1 hypothetical protein [Dyadobacter chenwenxiniae]